MKFLTNHSKFIYLTFGIIIAVALLLGLFYSTAYADVHVYYTYSDGVQFGKSAQGPITGTSNQYLYDFFANQGEDAAFVAKYGTSFEPFAKTVYDFQVKLSSFNTTIITFELIGLVCFALLLILANHSRRVYYKSNLIGGVLLPLVVVVLNVVLLVQNLGVGSAFNENTELFNMVAVLQNDKTNIVASQQNFAYLKDHFSVTSTSITLYMVLFIVVIVVSLFMAIYAVLKYKATAKDREEILKKAVQKND